MLVSLTVGKVDAGMAVLLTDDKRIVRMPFSSFLSHSPPFFQVELTILQIEFPSILLPSDITTGSIVDITVSRNISTEASTARSFNALQSKILSTFGSATPSPPQLGVRNTTQTAVVLEWAPIQPAQADIRSLSLFRNGAKAGTIPNPAALTATKVSGLAVDTEYEFQLLLKTSAGSFWSNKLAVRTHALNDVSGIVVTPGIMSPAIKANLVARLERIGARLSEHVRIDTTHFVCVEPRGEAWERARDLNVPIVLPEWLEACEMEKRIVGVRSFYLDADPRARQAALSQLHGQKEQFAANAAASPSEQERPRTPVSTPRTNIIPPTPEQTSRPPVPPKDEDSISKKVVEEDEEDEDDEDVDEDDEDEVDDRKGKAEAKGKKTSVEDGKERDDSFQDVTL
jgi:chitin biosynthesis protein CHS5